MNIVITGSLGNIGRPLTEMLVSKGHHVTVISSKSERKSAIEALKATPALGSIQDVNFLTTAFIGADIVYLMEPWEGIGSLFDHTIDFRAEFVKIANNYVKAVQDSGVKKIVHLSSVGAHTEKGTGSLLVHHAVEKILRTLPEEVSIKFIRPVGFFTNIYRWLPMIKSRGAIIQSYGGDKKEPWVSPYDIALAITEEIAKPFIGKTAHYVASDEVSPNEIAESLGKSIDNINLRWEVISSEELLKEMLSKGINEWIAEGLVAMQKAQASGSLSDDYHLNKSELGKVKLSNFAEEFAEHYKKQNN